MNVNNEHLQNGSHDISFLPSLSHHETYPASGPETDWYCKAYHSKDEREVLQRCSESLLGGDHPVAVD